MYKIVVCLAILTYTIGHSQSLQPLEFATNHYLELGKLNTEPNPERATLDSLRFFPESYNSVALLYTQLHPSYLTQDQINQLKQSVAFPANSSDQTRAELDFLLEWQSKRTEKHEERAARVLAPIGYWPHIDVMDDHPDHKKNIQDLFFEGRTLLGDECNADNYPATAKLLKGITKDMRIMEFTVKYHLLRARPYVLEPRLKPLQIMGSPSFASGHTLWAYIHAFAWGELIPNKRGQFLELAYEIGESREIMGIHYPSDEEAARILAHRMLSAMVSNPNFIKDFNMAKSEWKDKK